MSERITYRLEGPVAVIEMHRAPVNAVDFEMIDAIHDAFRRADADPDVGAIVLTSGLDGMYCAGMDLKMIRGSGAEGMRKFLNRFYLDTLDVQAKLTKPTIAAVNGVARGAGMSLSITCDVIVASERADLGYPEINVGVLPAIHFAHLPAVIGRHRAFELLLTGESFGPERAKEMGLVNHVVPHEQLMEKALELGRTFAAKSPTAMRIGRLAFWRAQDLDYRRSVAAQVEMMCALAETDDFEEGLAAFAEKRKPDWGPRG
ncbi:MAG: enoyl-CoA hydratase/isomerase family protein [Minwuia sp.]|uniref:enoyl-CoA hydratase/isomerase family protein n=1 Tax=Minwuia sp. TaxID=2493630 RepID=UPI003A857A46